ncbi:hypothetical protein K8W59_14245 [Nocardioides rotundus]|uniref:alpha/beta hydrolase n=1 Tax=Nocardioides rotundus TaxID=1774216 RepID=UPI001CC0B797|nr:alpha/beta hydrolase [Nocardioides rotundus]UAL28963.1 hypothetical protein K8W59_14245 [Nocardioides rotundus]
MTTTAPPTPGPALPPLPPRRPRDPPAVEAFAGNLLRCAGDCAEAEETARTSRPRDWSGRAASTWTASLSASAEGLDTAAGSLRRVARAVDGWAAHARRIESALDRSDREHARLAALPDSPGPAVMRWAEERRALESEAAEHDRALAELLWSERPPTGAATRLSAAVAPVGLPAGPLEGAEPPSAAARDAVNRARLARDLARLEALPDPGPRTREVLEHLRALRATLERGSTYTDPVTGAPIPLQLWAYDPWAFDGDGRVAVAVGDLDRAENIAVQVPGLGTDAGDIPGLAERARAVHDAARFTAPGESTAVIAWIGYDAPDNGLPGERGADALGVVAEGHAARGGMLLGRDLDTIGAARADDPHVTVVGHSYGATTATVGAADGGLPGADELVLLGSPGAGSGTDHARETGLDSTSVWVGRNSRDPVPYLADHGWANGGVAGGGLGDDPAEDTWGAQRFAAEERDRGPTVSPGDHRAYFDHDSESLANLGRIVVGDTEDVVRVRPVHDPLLGPPVDPEWDRPVAPASRTPTREH